VSNLKWGVIFAVFAFVVSVLMGIVFGVAVTHIFLRALIFSVVFFGLGFGLRLIVNNYLPEVLYSDDAAQDDYGRGSYPNEQGSEQTGAGIVLDNTGEYALPELFKTSGGSDEMGNIEDLVSGRFSARNYAEFGQAKGIDANAEASYNNRVVSQDFSLGLPEEVPFMDGDYQDGYSDNSYQGGSGDDAPEERQAFTPSFGDGDSDGMGGLPDLDMMARAFSSFGGAPAQGPAAPAASSQPASGFVPTTVNEFVSTPEAPSSSGPSYNKGNKPEQMKGDFKPKELAEGIRAVLNKEK